MKLRLAKASQLSWSWDLAWLSLAISELIVGKDDNVDVDIYAIL